MIVENFVKIEMISYQQSTLWEINFTLTISLYDSWNNQLSTIDNQVLSETLVAHLQGWQL